MGTPNSIGYAIVRFADESVSEVPTKWLIEDNTMCWWPPTKNASTFISRNVTPTDSWKKFEVDVEGFCETLDVARRKAEDINYSESEEKGRGKRVKKKNMRTISECESSSESEIYNKRCLEKVPELKMFDVHEDGYLVECNEQKGKACSQSKKDQTSSNSPSGDINTCDDNDNFCEGNEAGQRMSHVSSPSITVCSNDEIHEASQILSHLSPQDSSTCNKNDLVTVLNKIVKGISAIQIQLEEIHNTLDQQRSDTNSVDKFQIIRRFLPINNLLELEKIELFIKESKQNEDLMKKYLFRIGGSGLKDNTARVYKNLFTNTFAVQCSWLGLRQNYKISSSILVQLVNCVILDMFPTAQLKEFETASSEWFRHAKQRMQREKVPADQLH